MTTRAFFFFLGSGLFGIPLVITYNRMVKECMERAPASEYISEYFGYPGKTFRVVSLYRNYCLTGRLHVAFLFLSLLTTGCLIAALISFVR
jgi:hypothetical protein